MDNNEITEELESIQNTDRYWPSKEEYDPGISKEQWDELLKDSEIFTKADLRLLAGFYIYNPCSYKKIESKFDYLEDGAAKGLVDQLAKKVYEKVHCPLAKRKDNSEVYWTILFTGRNAGNVNRTSIFNYKLRDELYEALTEFCIPEYLGNQNSKHWICEIDQSLESELQKCNTIEISLPETQESASQINIIKIGDIFYVLIDQRTIVAKGIVISDDYIDSNIHKRKIFLTEIGTTKSKYTHMEESQLLLIKESRKIEKIESVIREGVKMERSIYPKNIILYGPPGTGKTYNAIRYAAAIIENTPIEDIQKEDYSNVKSRYDTYVKNHQIAFTTFHQSYGYEDFIEGIKPDVSETGTVSYEIQDGIFKDFVKKTKQENRYVFIIDEINRGNISKIFGELITLIEDSKRKGEAEALSAILPYTKKEFSIPSNIFILGTMNTADRSIALMDSALRRRFHFIEMMPDSSVLKGVVVEGLNISRMLEVINKRITYLYDREHTIGQAFFMPLVDDHSLDCLADIFKNKIIPLLQEYFYDDYEKIQLVLGDNGKEEQYQFIQNERIDSDDLFYGNLDELDLLEKSYRINEKAFKQIESYKKIMK